MNNLISYTFKNSQIRTTVIDSEPWFVATDVAQALEYSDATHALRYLDDDERGTLPIKEGNKSLNIINESGLYSLILRSRKPEAKAFKKFVTSEILPSIRKTGYYGESAINMRAIGGMVCDEQEIRETKNFLTSNFFYDYAGDLKTSSGTRSRQLGEFFIPALWRTRTVNISNSGQPLDGFSESAAYSVLGGNLKHRVEKMKELISYTFKNSQIRTTVIEGEPWFVATDVAQALEYRAANDAIRTLDDDEKGTHILRTLGGNQELTIINESGLYSLILRSRKPEAKAFKKFVTSEILPSIRKTGYYGESAINMRAIGGMVKRCTAVAVRDEIQATIREEVRNTAIHIILAADKFKPLQEVTDDMMLHCLYNWYSTRHHKLLDTVKKLGEENSALKSKIATIKKTIN